MTAMHDTSKTKTQLIDELETLRGYGVGSGL